MRRGATLVALVALTSSTAAQSPSCQILFTCPFGYGRQTACYVTNAGTSACAASTGALTLTSGSGGTTQAEAGFPTTFAAPAPGGTTIISGTLSGIDIINSIYTFTASISNSAIASTSVVNERCDAYLSAPASASYDFADPDPFAIALQPTASACFGYRVVAASLRPVSGGTTYQCAATSPSSRMPRTGPPYVVTCPDVTSGRMAPGDWALTLSLTNGVTGASPITVTRLIIISHTGTVPPSYVPQQRRRRRRRRFSKRALRDGIA